MKSPQVGADVDLELLAKTSRGGSVVADAFHPPFRRNSQWLDAVVTDPPFGMREGRRDGRGANTNAAGLVGRVGSWADPSGSRSQKKISISPSLKTGENSSKIA